jgi:hypothetical protein
MQSTTSKLVLSSLAGVALAASGCRTIGTAGGTAGDVAADTARAAGNAAGTAAHGAGKIVKDTAGAAEDEMD